MTNILAQIQEPLFVAALAAAISNMLVITIAMSPKLHQLYRACTPKGTVGPWLGMLLILASHSLALLAIVVFHVSGLLKLQWREAWLMLASVLMIIALCAIFERWAEKTVAKSSDTKSS